MSHAVLFVVLSFVALLVHASVWSMDKSVPTNATGFKAFQQNFLLVYLIVMASDWLQGPYVYALYASYGFSKSDIGILFVVGFGSSGIFGVLVGAIADIFGRKLSAILFTITYSLCCLTKHFNNFTILLFGRFLGGISTSLLFSVFDAWMIHEHHRLHFDDTWLSQTFSRATFLNGLIAILSGLFASGVTSLFGPVAPFDAAVICLIAAAVIISFTWVENRGVAAIVSSIEIKKEDDENLNTCIDTKSNSFLPSQSIIEQQQTSTTMSATSTASPYSNNSATTGKINININNKNYNAGVKDINNTRKDNNNDKNNANNDYNDDDDDQYGTTGHTNNIDNKFDNYDAQNLINNDDKLNMNMKCSVKPQSKSVILSTMVGDVLRGMYGAAHCVLADPKIFLCGSIQSCFEGGMYIFVFMWTPSLDDSINHGLVFSLFMVAIMIGSGIYSQTASIRADAVLIYPFLVSFVAFLTPVLTTSSDSRLLSYICFEICCGIYFPCFYTLRSRIVPDNGRAAIINLFRIPLNLLVLINCLLAGSVTTETVFLICSILMGAAFVQSVMLSRLISTPKTGSSYIYNTIFTTSDDSLDSLDVSDTISPVGNELGHQPLGQRASSKVEMEGRQVELRHMKVATGGMNGGGGGRRYNNNINMNESEGVGIVIGKRELKLASGLSGDKEAKETA